MSARRVGRSVGRVHGLPLEAAFSRRAVGRQSGQPSPGFTRKGAASTRHARRHKFSAIVGRHVGLPFRVVLRFNSPKIARPGRDPGYAVRANFLSLTCSLNVSAFDSRDFRSHSALMFAAASLANTSRIFASSRSHFGFATRHHARKKSAGDTGTDSSPVSHCSHGPRSCRTESTRLPSSSTDAPLPGIPDTSPIPVSPGPG